MTDNTNKQWLDWEMFVAEQQAMEQREVEVIDMFRSQFPNLTRLYDDIKSHKPVTEIVGFNPIRLIQTYIQDWDRIEKSEDSYEDKGLNYMLSEIGAMQHVFKIPFDNRDQRREWLALVEESVAIRNRRLGFNPMERRDDKRVKPIYYFESANHFIAKAKKVRVYRSLWCLVS